VKILLKDKEEHYMKKTLIFQ